MNEGETRVQATGGVRLRAREVSKDNKDEDVNVFIAEADSTQWTLPSGRTKDTRGTLLLQGTEERPAEISRTGVGQNIAERMQMNLDTGEIKAGE